MPNALWSYSTLRALFPSCPLKEGSKIGGISFDTRTLDTGDLFFAIQGETLDGHTFVQDALNKGALAAFVRQGFHHPAVPEDRLIRVDEPLEALNLLARAARFRFQGRVVGVTGSAGKTSFKEGLKYLFGQQGSVHANVKSYNNQWGVPLTLAHLPSSYDWAVVEMGMNHPGELSTLTALTQPHLAVITTVGTAHLAFFDSEAAIADAKAEIFEGVGPGGYALLPRDNLHYERLENHARPRHLEVLSFGQHPQADCRLIHLSKGPQQAHIKANILGHTLDYTLSDHGMHRILNSLGLLGSVALMGGDVKRAAQDLIHLHAPEGRGQVHPVTYQGHKILVLDESYNANPLSMRAALQSLAGYEPLTPSGKRIALLGDMRELGPQADDLHRDLAPLIAELPIHTILTCGTHMKHLHDALPPSQRGPHVASSQDLLPFLPQLLQEGDVVMMKGSLSMGMRVVLSALLPPQETVKGMAC